MQVDIPPALKPDAPDARLADDRASCSVWWRDTPTLDGGRVGCIGHFESAGDPRPILDEACALLAERGCAIAVGPLDGSTWRKYRFVTDAGSEPPFLLEPRNPPEWPKAWEAAGFAPIMRYTSALQEGFEAVDPRADVRERELVREGYSFRTLDATDYDAELRRIYPLLTASFAQNFLYTPLPLDRYLELYRPLGRALLPETVVIAEHGTRCVGLFFTYPTDARTLVLKTIAVHPDHEGKGLGGVLAARVMRAARAAGFQRAIHALMQQENRSRRISAHYGAAMREYALYGRPL